LKLRFAKALFVLVMLHLFLTHIRLAYLFYFLLPLIISFEIATQYARLSAASWKEEIGDAVTQFLKRHTASLSVTALSAYLVITAGFLVLSKSSPRETLRRQERSTSPGPPAWPATS